MSFPAILRQETGNIAVLTAVLLVPIIGIVGMGVEASSWLVMSRAAQNAADSAAVAAANNATATLQNSYPQYAWEGWAAGRQYGFAKSASPTLTSAACSAPYQAYTCSKAAANNAVVEIANGVTCPDTTTNCHLAIVTKKLPIFLTRAIGYLGDTTVGAGRGVTVVSYALAEPISAISFVSCITAVGSDTSLPNNPGAAISGNGTPNASGPGCSLSAAGPAPSSIKCTGSTGLGAYYGFATGTITGSGAASNCVVDRTTSSTFVFCDPYAATVASGCPASTYGTAAANAVAAAKAAGCNSGSGYTFSGKALGNYLCFNSNVTLDAPITSLLTDGTAIVLTDGASIDMNSNAASNVTIIFDRGTATNPGTFASSNTSNVTINSPNSGPLSGIAAYQILPRACTVGSGNCADWTVNGNVRIDITGAIYLPYTNASFGGNVQTLSTGRCFIGVFNSFATNGTGYVLDRSGCNTEGLGSLPTVLRYRAALVK